MTIAPHRYPIRARGPNGRRIAVIGAGISGLSAAWLLASRHDVTVYEEETWAGGHSNTVDVDSPFGRIAVDTGFIVYNEANYPNLAALFDHLGVETRPSVMSFAASIGSRLEYSSADINSLLGQRSNLVSLRFWRMVRDILSFYARAKSLVDDPQIEGKSLGAFLDSAGYSNGLVEDHILPMCAAIWSTTARDIRDLPLRAFIRFFASHGLLDVHERPQWRTVAGGSREYVRRLVEPLRGRVRLATGARRIIRDIAGVTVVDATGERTRFDEVVLATHADDALRLLDTPDPEERHLLGAFRYTENRAVLHDDAALMPRRKRVWSSWNYIGDDAGDGNAALCVTYWMNRLQGLDERQPLFLTLNPIREPAPRSVKRSFAYSHPLFDHQALESQKGLWRLQGNQRTWFCGSYFGYGFHEDALQAGLAVAEELGGLRRPWQVPAESGRISREPAFLAAAE